MHLKACFKGAVTTIGCMLVLSLFLSTYYHFGNISNQTLSYLISFIVATSFLLGSFLSGYVAGEKGLLNGLVSASLVICLIAIVLLLGEDAAKDWSKFFMNIIFALISSTVGGIIGVTKN